MTSTHTAERPRTDWKAIHAGDLAVPPGADLDLLLEELADCLADPDPAVRDGEPYLVLRAWISRDVIDRPRRRRLGDLMAGRFTDPRIQARTFAPLVLDMIVSRGDFQETWLDAFCRWYPAETDLRGHDPQLGWLHAVAHGADLLAAFGGHPDVDPAVLLNLAARRLLAPTDHVWREQEDDRLAHAIALTLTRTDLTQAAATGWLEPIGADFATPCGGQTPAYRSNAMRALRMVYILADLGVPTGGDSAPRQMPHATAVKARLVPVLAEVFRQS